MIIYNESIKLATILAKENNLKKSEKWLKREIHYLLAKYPELRTFIYTRIELITLTDILIAFFNMKCANQKGHRIKYYRKIKSLPEKKLKELRLSHYLTAGLSMWLVLDYCFNHRYNKNEYIVWNFNHTDAYKAILQTLAKNKFDNNVFLNSGGGGDNCNKFKPRQ